MSVNMKELLKNRVFRIVITTDLIQHISIWIRNFALLFYVMERTQNDPVAVSLLTVLEYIPIFLFSFIGGTLADRWNPKKTMITGDFLSAASIVIILLLISIGYWQAVFAATLVSAIVSQFSLPSSSIMFKKHIPDGQVTNAMAVSQSSQSVFMIIGPVIGTLVYTTMGITGSLVLITALFLCSALVQFLLPSSPRSSASSQSSILREMKEGLKYVATNRNLVIIACTFVFLGLGLGITQPLDVYIIVERLSLNKESLQFFYSLYGFGLLIGGAAAAAFTQRLNTKAVLFVGCCFFSFSIIVEVLSVWVVLTAGMRLLVGVMLAFVQIVLSTLLIKLVKEEYVGRVNGIISPALVGGTLIGSSFAGFLMKSASLIPTYFISAGVIFIGALLCLGFKTEKSALAEAEGINEANV